MRVGSCGRLELKMRLSPSLDRVGCMSSHAEFTVEPRLTGADHGPNCWAAAAGQNTANSATAARTAGNKTAIRIRDLFVMCSSSFFLSTLRGDSLASRERKQSRRNLEIYF